MTQKRLHILRSAAALLAVCALLAGCAGIQAAPSETASAAAATATAAPAVTATASAPPSAQASAQETAAVSTDAAVLFINVGYGDAALVQAGGKNYLIDTGSKASALTLLRALALFGVQRLDGVFLTHTHADHTGGMEAAAQRYEIGTLYSADISMDKENGGNVIDSLAEELALTHVKLSAGDTVDIAADTYFEVLGPVAYNTDDDNDNSLVMKLHAGGRTWLLTGDMQFEEEMTLTGAGADLSADVLKVGNHGNPDATSEAFAAAAGADIAVISTSTKEDTDSAAARVKTALGAAQIYVTQDYDCGVLAAISADGQIDVSDPQYGAPMADVAITGIDKDAQTLTLANSGGNADISGWMIYSEKGGELFVFPGGAVIEAGQTVSVACAGGGSGDYLWNDKKVWSDKAGEAAVLIDANGAQVSRVY